MTNKKNQRNDYGELIITYFNEKEIENEGTTPKLKRAADTVLKAFCGVDDVVNNKKIDAEKLIRDSEKQNYNDESKEIQTIEADDESRKILNVRHSENFGENGIEKINGNSNRKVKVVAKSGEKILGDHIFESVEEFEKWNNERKSKASIVYESNKKNVDLDDYV